MDGNNKQDPLKDHDKKRPGRSGFNLVITLLIVVFVAMLSVISSTGVINT